MIAPPPREIRQRSHNRRIALHRRHWRLKRNERNGMVRAMRGYLEQTFACSRHGCGKTRRDPSRAVIPLKPKYGLNGAPSVGCWLQRRRIFLSQNSITRRNLLKDSVTLAIGSSTIVRAAETALPSMMSGMDKDLKQRWVAIAESLNPNLQTITERPRAVVRLTADASQYLRWRVTDEGTEATLRKHLFRKGEEFILDFGGHRAGHLEFRLEGVGKSIDAPCRLRFTFGEVPGDVAEPLLPYKGQLSSAWLPLETVT